MFNKNKSNEYFGATNSSSAYIRTLQWATKLLTFAVIVLSVSMIYIVSKSDIFSDVQGNTAEAPAPVVAVVPDNSRTEILIARQRIEEGTRVSDNLVSVLAVPNEVVPAGAIRAADKNLYVGQYSKSFVDAGFPLRSDDFVGVSQNSDFRIPAGYRAITISVDSRSRVEGFARANSRVDVLWFYNDRTTGENVATLVRFAKVLSVGGVTGEEAQINNVAKAVQNQTQMTTLTLLVTEEEARIIELARNKGSLSLSLVGQEEPLDEKVYPDSVNVREVLKRVRTATTGGIASDGALTMYDPKVGKDVKFVLSNNRWIPEEEFKRQNEGDAKPIAQFRTSRARLSDESSAKDEL